MNTVQAKLDLSEGNQLFLLNWRTLTLFSLFSEKENSLDKRSASSIWTECEVCEENGSIKAKRAIDNEYDYLNVLRKGTDRQYTLQIAIDNEWTDTDTFVLPL